jgi:hypothetical protein
MKNFSRAGSKEYFFDRQPPLDPSTRQPISRPLVSRAPAAQPIDEAEDGESTEARRDALRAAGLRVALDSRSVPGVLCAHSPTVR